MMIKWLLTRYSSRFISEPPATEGIIATSTPQPGLSIYTQHLSPSRESQRLEVTPWPLPGCLCIDIILASADPRLMRNDSFGSGLWRLHPESPLSQYDFNSLALAGPSLRSVQNLGMSGATDNAGFFPDSVRHFDPAQSPEFLRPTSSTRSCMNPKSQGHQNGRRKSPKSAINRVQKPGTSRTRGPKTAIACENCR